MALKKTLYALLFVAILPLSLFAWARATAPFVNMPAPFPPALGAAGVVLGLGLLAAGMTTLWFQGGGLPMNAFPPPRLATKGIYRFMAHPIYVGFCFLVAGFALVFHSGSGYWLVAPMVILACVALVHGYEDEALRARFGIVPKAALRLPADDSAPPSSTDRLSSYLLVLGPWVILYEALRALGTSSGAWSALLPFEARLPVVQWTEILYFSVYPLTAIAPLVAASRRDLRQFAVRGLMAMAVVFPLYLTLPFYVPLRSFTPSNAFGRLIIWEGVMDTPAEAFPSFHVIWALLAAEVFASRMPKLRWLWRAWAWMVAIACVLTGAHAIVDVVAGFAVVALVVSAPRLWQRLRALSERVANSWREWHIGPVRVINHGFYAGAGTFVALAIVGNLAGPGHRTAILVVALMGLLGAGLWAQYVEGSPRLLRPFGYYGGVLGVALGGCLLAATGVDPWLVVAAYATAGPWVQSLGRLRCLVQGCCHGRPAPETIGIRYVHPRSRVCRLSDWKGVSLHPTPLYSILWNIPVAIATLRLWTLHAPLTLVAGVYLLLTGCGRFVEEAFRGEPQTPIHWGLRLYQWTALVTVVSGAVLTCLGGAPAPTIHLRWQPLLLAIPLGLLTSLAMGVDFPGSNRRFARLV